MQCVYYQILTINSGSSSIKFSLHDCGGLETLVMRGALEHIGQHHGRLRVCDPTGACFFDEQSRFPDHRTALHRLFDWLQGQRLDRCGRCHWCLVGYEWQPDRG